MIIAKTVKRMNMKIVPRVERNNEISADTETLILVNLREEIDIIYEKFIFLTFPFLFSLNNRYTLKHSLKLLLYQKPKSGLASFP